MTEFTSTERLDFLLEMALTIHEGIVEHLEGNDELDNQLITRLKEADHFIVVKKALQGHLVDHASNTDSDNKPAPADTTPPSSHYSHSTATPSPQTPSSPSLFFSSPEPHGTPTSTPARRKATRRIPGETQGSKALRKMRRSVPYASWVDKPKSFN
ncbi:hypothetical protein FVEG_13466 [Fusarium verticillioides 7600]|uniref:Uncharacterized protein n=1 Tax=Gibberella moniliformis (strain M3125 / FGSC 7600) TaxID=334819 RepID=W7NGJ6_GIBM7|nr:hypothetical protein FVEG_13466 [Fusarium verticillioides 7600]EWG55472.1 hypothetical protein FVEG_13466 [Fusarium verticillioides 7600]RBQ96717.1 hypothetical protein FVER53263_13466 [Fusarium verticillioides]